MPESMTGFSSAVVKGKDFYVRIELRSLNSKGLDISIKGSRDVTPAIEKEIRHLISETFQRGYFSVYVDVISLKPLIFQELDVLKSQLNSYRELFNKLGLTPTDDRLLSLLLDKATPNVKEEKEIARIILKGFKKTIKDLKKERIFEGKGLLKEIRLRLKDLEAHLKTIERKKPILLQEIKKDISKRIKELAGEGSERAWMEASILADKSDVREEVVRFRLHIERFKEILREKGPVGKKLDFLCQEMHREANTMATKLPALSEVVVDARSEIERIRQQLHNLE